MHIEEYNKYFGILLNKKDWKFANINKLCVIHLVGNTHKHIYIHHQTLWVHTYYT